MASKVKAPARAASNGKLYACRGRLVIELYPGGDESRPVGVFEAPIEARSTGYIALSGGQKLKVDLTDQDGNTSQKVLSRLFGLESPGGVRFTTIFAAWARRDDVPALEEWLRENGYVVVANGVGSDTPKAKRPPAASLF